MRKIILFAMILLFACPVFADFISSKTSQIFHELDCRYAAPLNDTNAFLYSTYNDAIEAGLRPCLVCEPQPDIDEPGEPEEPEEPNGVIIIPPKEASIIIPMKGVILGMDYCQFPYTGGSVGEPIIIKEERAVTLREAIDKGRYACLHFSIREDPLFPIVEPESSVDPNTPLLDEYGRSESYWHSYFYNILTVFNYNQFDPNEVVFLSARQHDWLQNTHMGYINYQLYGATGNIDNVDDKMEWAFYVEGTEDGEAYDITKFIHKYITDTITTGKFVYGTMIDIEPYELEELTIQQSLLQYAMDYMKERYNVKDGEISYPITPTEKYEPIEIDYDQIVYISLSNTTYHPKDCGHFNGYIVKMINRETEIVATNNATWYPESGILAWRITPFEMGDYIAIANSDVGQTELASVTVRPNRSPTTIDMINTWLKGNFDLTKFAEFAKNFGTIIDTTPMSIVWVFEGGRWVPYGGVKSDGSGGRILAVEEHEIIDEITERHRTTKTYERPLSKHSVIWEKTKVVVVEVTTTTYIREGDDTTPAPLPAAGTSRIEWVFENGAWVPQSLGGTYEANPYLDDNGNFDEEKFLALKPLPPIKPDPNDVDAEEARLRAIMEESKELAPLIEKLMASAPPRATYEDNLIAYGATYAEYEKELEIWEATMEGIRMEKERREVEDHWEEDKMGRMEDEIMLMDEEHKIGVLGELLEDSRITDEQKGTLREILNTIREIPITETP